MSEQFASLYKNFSFLEFLAQITQHELSSATLETLFSAEELAIYYQRYEKTAFVDLTREKIQASLEQQLSEKMALSIKALVIKVEENGVVVGFANPFDQAAIAAVESVLQVYIKPVMVKAQELQRMTRLVFRKTKAIQTFADEISVHEKMVETIEVLQVETDSRISELAKLIVRDAYEMQASDIHIEVTRETFKIRLRIDGALQEYPIYNYKVSDYLIRYLKLLADVDITENQKPTEGKKVTLLIEGKEVNLRLSFMPTYYGQSIAIRLLGEAASYKLQDKIHHSDYYSAIQEYLAKSCGMFLISGPTGSGKTTTLYSALQEVNRSDTKIITLEDPIEAHIPGINQIQINEMIHYDFADGIRAILHQDPDIIMVGEVRDEVTANMVVRAAMTGHLVLATIHARGVVEIPLRLLNLKVDPYLLANTLSLNASQRLVRGICPHCKVVAATTVLEQAFLKKNFPKQEAIFYKGEGCYYCQFTGFSYREAVFEILHMTPLMIEMLANHNIAAYLSLAKEAIKGKSLLDHAFQLAIEGITPLSEVLRMESN